MAASWERARLCCEPPLSLDPPVGLWAAVVSGQSAGVGLWGRRGVGACGVKVCGGGGLVALGVVPRGTISASNSDAEQAKRPPRGRGTRPCSGTGTPRSVSGCWARGDRTGGWRRRLGRIRR